jgi:hypothetical protein
MRIRQYWVHDDEPMEETPLPPPAKDEAAPAPPYQEWERLLNALLDLLEPHPALYRAALHLLAGRAGPLPPLPT